MAEERERLEAEEKDDTEGHKRREDLTGDDDVEGHKYRREDLTGDDDVEGHKYR